MPNSSSKSEILMIELTKDFTEDQIDLFDNLSIDIWACGKSIEHMRKILIDNKQYNDEERKVFDAFEQVSKVHDQEVEDDYNQS
jgi:hypothetical protein